MNKHEQKKDKDIVENNYYYSYPYSPYPIPYPNIYPNPSSRWSCTASGVCVENNYSGEYTNLNSCVQACSRLTGSFCNTCNNSQIYNAYPNFPYGYSYPFIPSPLYYSPPISLPSYSVYPPYNYPYYPQSLLYYRKHR